MARPSPESFEKRQRERRKQRKRAEKLERRLIRNDEKKRAKTDPDQAGENPLSEGEATHGGEVDPHEEGDQAQDGNPPEA